MTLIDDQTKLDTLRALIFAKRTWLGTFSHGRQKRPDHEIERKGREARVLEAIASDYEARMR